MSSNISDSLPDKSDNPSITLRKTSGGLDETKKSLVNTTDTVVTYGNTDMGIKYNLVNEAITPPIAEKNIETVNKTDKSQASNISVDTSSSNKSDKYKSLDKSRSNQRTDA